jgi:hypothetical protein
MEMFLPNNVVQIWLVEKSSGVANSLVLKSAPRRDGQSLGNSHVHPSDKLLNFGYVFD